MRRKPRNPRYKLKATYIENDHESTFYCKENRISNITNEMGQSMPMSNGEKVLETDSALDFKIEQEVRIGTSILGIYQINQSIDTKDLNSMRGVPKYITTLLVK